MTLKKILVVDDDKDILTVAKFCLEDSGFEIEYVSSGQEAIQKAMKNIPDLIILDVMMPEMDGIATMKALKLIPSLANVPILFLTAKAQDSEVAYYLSLGVIGVITKPFEPMKLQERILEYWEKAIKNRG